MGMTWNLRIEDNKMTEVEKLYKKLMETPMSVLLVICSQALDRKMSTQRIDFLFTILKARLAQDDIKKSLELK